MEVGRRKHDESRPKPIRNRLWWIVISPLVWSLHFLACYITTAIWCEKYAATSDSQIEDLADYFAGQTREATYKKEESSSDTDLQDAELIQLGKQLANQGDASEKIPSCVDCHGPAEWLQSNAYPRLAGQPAWYIVRQLELFSKQQRGGEEAEIMHPIADKLGDKTRHAIAAYYADTSLLGDANGDGSIVTTRQERD